MFSRLFIANRGEIAVRIIRACRELGITTLLPFHPVDRGSLAVKLADEAYPVLDRAPRELFLDAKFLVDLAVTHKASALHPGYGFLSENPVLSLLCFERDITFVGPHPGTQQALGDKNGARQVMIKAGVPVVPGTETPCASLDEAMRAAVSIGFPVLLKAARGGGGRGMRRVNSEAELEGAFQAAGREAKSAFGDGRIYLEKYLERPRHIEIQIMGDSHGNIVYVGERECSIQRRYQKLIEEAPSFVVGPELRKAMGEAAVRGAKAVSYQGAGTMEFLVDENYNFYFLELNARIQVEHPVTELITGLDLVKEQILVASGEPLSFYQEDIKLNGWAIECRINSEDPMQNFMPTPGKITAIEWPAGPGIRVETGVVTGYEISTHYDSLVAKLLAWGKTREEARIRMLGALEECNIEGVKTTIPFHKAVLTHSGFIEGRLSTHFLEEVEIMNKTPELPQEILQVAAIAAAYKIGCGSSITEFSDTRYNGTPINGGVKGGNWQAVARLEAIGSLGRKGWMRR